MTDRIQKLRQEMKVRNLDAVLVEQPENRRYISGFTGSTGTVLVTLSDAWFFTDSRYTDQATEQCQGFTLVESYGAAATRESVGEKLTAASVKRVAFEEDFLTYAQASAYHQLPGVEWVPSDGLLETIRLIKDAGEVAQIDRAAQIADAAFEHILGYVKPGLTEREVAWELESFMRKQGATGPSFETIVASGWRSSLPHGVATDKVLESGDFVKLDFGAVYEGYVSDITRTIVLGKPSDKQLDVYHTVLEAQLRALDVLKVGMTGREADAAARDLIDSKGYAGAFGHSLGHGIGLAVHEGPRLAKTSDDVLKAGMVVTVEPGIYLSKWGGVRIEDDVLLLEDGKRILTNAPKLELIAIA